VASLIFADSFQFYDVVHQADQLYNTAELRYANGNDVISGSSLLPGSVYGSAKTVWGSQTDEITLGIRYQTPRLDEGPIVIGNDASGFYFQLVGVGDGRFTFVTSLAGSPAQGLITGKAIKARTWYYFELHLQVTRQYQPYVPATLTTPAIPEAYWNTCFYDFWVNGEAWVSFATVDSPRRRTVGDGTVGTNPWIEQMALAFAAVDSRPGIMTDLYITGGGRDPLGDVAVVPLYPDGDGDSDWTPHAGSTHYTMVNSAPPDGTTYNTADSAGQEDSYSLQDIPAFNGTIKGTVAVWWMTLSDPGAGAAFGFYNTDDKATGLFYPSYGSWQYFIDPERYFPDSSDEWTQSQINNLTLGIARFS
jgi:hypothetical protein